MKVRSFINLYRHLDNADLLVYNENGEPVHMDQVVQLHTATHHPPTSLVLTNHRSHPDAIQAVPNPPAVEYINTESPDSLVTIQFRLKDIDAARFVEWVKTECSVAEDGDGQIHGKCEIVNPVRIEFDA